MGEEGGDAEGPEGEDELSGDRRQARVDGLARLSAERMPHAGVKEISKGLCMAKTVGICRTTGFELGATPRCGLAVSLSLPHLQVDTHQPRIRVRIELMDQETKANK